MENGQSESIGKPRRINKIRNRRPSLFDVIVASFAAIGALAGGYASVKIYFVEQDRDSGNAVTQAVKNVEDSLKRVVNGAARCGDQTITDAPRWSDYISKSEPGAVAACKYEVFHDYLEDFRGRLAGTDSASQNNAFRPRLVEEIETVIERFFASTTALPWQRAAATVSVLVAARIDNRYSSVFKDEKTIDLGRIIYHPTNRIKLSAGNVDLNLDGSSIRKVDIYGVGGKVVAAKAEISDSKLILEQSQGGRCAVELSSSVLKSVDLNLGGGSCRLVLDEVIVETSDGGNCSIEGSNVSAHFKNGAISRCPIGGSRSSATDIASSSKGQTSDGEFRFATFDGTAISDLKISGDFYASDFATAKLSAVTFDGATKLDFSIFPLSFESNVKDLSVKNLKEASNFLLLADNNYQISKWCIIPSGSTDFLCGAPSQSHLKTLRKFFASECKDQHGTCLRQAQIVAQINAVAPAK